MIKEEEFNRLMNQTPLDEWTEKNVVEVGEYAGKKFSQENDHKVETNQIRNFFSAIVVIRQKWRNKKIRHKANKAEANVYAVMYTNELYLLKPRLAYAAGREKKIEEMYNLFSKLIDKAAKVEVGPQDSRKDKNVVALENFIQITETLVAYHKFYSA